MYESPADALNPASGGSHADHAHLDGKCTSWVDEALDAAGPEYADAPRPGSCCEKDAKDRAEAARIRRIVSAADPVRKATALRTSNDPRNAVGGGFVASCIAPIARPIPRPMSGPDGGFGADGGGDAGDAIAIEDALVEPSGETHGCACLVQ